jgi:hypothetical protein
MTTKLHHTTSRRVFSFVPSHSAGPNAQSPVELACMHVPATNQHHFFSIPSEVMWFLLFLTLRDAGMPL